MEAGSNDITKGAQPTHPRAPGEGNRLGGLALRVERSQKGISVTLFHRAETSFPANTFAICNVA